MKVQWVHFHTAIQALLIQKQKNLFYQDCVFTLFFCTPADRPKKYYFLLSDANTKTINFTLEISFVKLSRGGKHINRYGEKSKSNTKSCFDILGAVVKNNVSIYSMCHVTCVIAGPFSSSQHAAYAIIFFEMRKIKFQIQHQVNCFRFILPYS